MSLSIESIEISDGLDQLAQTARLRVAPSDRVAAPSDEILNSFDSVGKLSVTDLRPTGESVEVEVSHGNVPEHVTFKGYVDFVDDTVNPSSFISSVELSALPLDRQHKTRVTMLWTNVALPGTEEDTITAHQILQDICDAADMPLGRIDFPNYQVVGTFECDGKTVVEVAEELVKPFNHFEYMQYYVCVSEQDGLEVLGFDFSGNDAAYGFTPQNVYDIPNILNYERRYERYMPDNQMGDLDILLLGGDYLVPPSTAVFGENDPRDPGIPVANKEAPQTADEETHYTYEVEETFTTESNSTEKETRVRTERTCTLTVRTTNFSVDTPTSLTEITDEFFRLVQEGSAASVYGALYNVEILENRLTQETTFEYENNELKRKVEKAYMYEEKDFSLNAPKNLVIYAKATDTVLAQVEELTTIYVGTEYPLTLNKSYLLYDGFGQQYKTETKEYTSFPGATLDEDQQPTANSIAPRWYYKNTHWVDADTLDTLQNQIRMIAEAIRLRRGQPVNQLSNQNFGFSGSTEESYTFNTTDKQNIAQYKLVNGKPFRPEDVLSPYRDLSRIIDSYAQADPTAAYSQIELLKRNAFVLQCPYMTFKGLMVVYNMCLRQREIERARSYWEHTTITSVIDTNVASGARVKAKDSVGVVTSLSHNIEASKATSSMTVRRLIVPNDQ
jgi:hypothetical protein